MSMADSVAAAIATNRFGLGARPGELANVAPDPRGWLLAQLSGGSPPVPGAAALEGSEAILARAAVLREEMRDRKRATADPRDSEEKLRRAAQGIGAYYRPLYVAEVQARFRAAVASDRPLVERLVHFWANHFAVSVDKAAVLGVAGAFEREAIRPHVLGRFEDLLFAVERHPAMLLYLDNFQSVGPGSVLARRATASRRRHGLGLNENLAREILELHTLGVDGGYTQADVTSFARMITGWSIGGGRGRLAEGEPGRFAFRANLHEPGAQQLLGRRYAQAGYGQGEAALRDLARHPATARHLAQKLARHFIADDPPAAAVEQIATAFERHEGELIPVYRAIIDAPEAWETPLAKYKTPADYIHSAYRGLELPTDGQRAGLTASELLGQRTWSPGSPAGWPDSAADWDGASALLKRIEWADAVGARLGDRRDAQRTAPAILGGMLSKKVSQAIARAASGAQAVTLLLTAPEFMRR